ncbi:MAG: ISAs1 family transposase [Thermodesulfobacteriota bacterium]
MTPQTNDMTRIATPPTLILGQIHRGDHSNECTVIPRLLKSLDIADCILLAEGAGPLRTLAREIVGRKAHYVFRMERFHGRIYDDVVDFFSRARSTAFRNASMDHLERMEARGGRRGIHRYWYARDVAWLAGMEEWPAMSGVGLVESDFEGEATIRRYYLSSIEDRPGDFFRAVMGHCPGEHPTHWSISLAFPETKSIETAARNFMILRQVFQ